VGSLGMVFQGASRGTFRTEEHATLFADIRSVIATARKQSRNLIATLALMLQTPETLGDSLVDEAKR